jgi:truncated hemoglobin YjbI
VEEKMETIDYTKLNERIVEQAYEAVLNKEQLQKLIQDKFERARQYREALVKSPTFSVN